MDQTVLYATHTICSANHLVLLNEILVAFFFSKFLLFGILQDNFGVRLYSYELTFSITLAPFSIGYIYAP